MKNTAPQARPYFWTRFFRWFLGWRTLRHGLIALVGLITLIAIVYTVEDWRGKRAWENYKRELEAKGAQLDFAAHVPPEVPDDQNFAMTPFFAPLYDFVPGTQKHRDTDAVERVQNAFRNLGAVRAGRWREGEKTDLARWLRDYQERRKPDAGEVEMTEAVAELSRAEQASAVLEILKQWEPILDEIRTASRRPHARFNIHYSADDPVNVLLPHLASVRGISQALALRASAELALDRSDAALADASLIIYLAGTIQAEPLLISQLVRIACLQIAMQVLWEGLAGQQWSDEQLRQWQKQLEGLNLVADGRRGLEGERAVFGTRLFDYIRDNPGVWYHLGADPDGSASSAPTPWAARLIPKGWFYFEQLNYNRAFDERLLPGSDPVAKRVHAATIEQNAAALEASFGNGLRAVLRHEIAISMLLPALNKFHMRTAHGQSVMDHAIIACALERHRLARGHHPETLDALAPRFLETIPHDVITGELPKYRRTESGEFVLYSVGWNGRDDGGVRGLTKQDRIDPAAGDWVWSYSPE